MIKKILTVFIGIIFISVALGNNYVFLPVDILNNIPIYSLENWIPPHNSLIADPVFQFEPWRIFAKQSILNGEIPLWNDLNGAGAPFLANLQSAAFFPLNFFYYFFPPSISLFAISFSKLSLLFLFSFLYFKKLFGRNVSLIAALTASTAAFPTVWLNWPHTNVYMLLPLFLFIFETNKEIDKRKSYIILTGLTYFLGILGGHPETLFHITLVVLLYVFLRNSSLKFLWYTFLGFFMGMLLGSFLILPFAEYLLNSSMLTQRSLGANFHFVPIAGLIYMVSPFLTGAPHIGLNASLWSFSNFQEYVGGYVGLLAFSLGIFTILRKTNESIVKVWAVIFAFSIVLSYRIPHLDFLTDLPLLNISSNHRLMGFGGFALIVLFAHFLQETLNNKKKKRRAVSKFLTASLVVASILSAIFAVGLLGPVVSEKINSLVKIQAHQAFITTLSILMFLTALFFVKHKTVAVLLISVSILLQTLGFFATYNTIAKKSAYYPENEIISVLRQGNRILEVGNPNFPENLNIVYGIGHTQNYDALEVGNYKKVFDKDFPDKNHWGNPESVTYESLNKFGVDTVISDYDINNKKIPIQTEATQRIHLKRVVSIDFKGIDAELKGLRVLTENFNRKNSCKLTFDVFENGTRITETEISCLDIRDNMYFSVPLNAAGLKENNKYSVVISPEFADETNTVALKGNNSGVPFLELLVKDKNLYEKQYDKKGIYIFRIPGVELIETSAAYKILKNESQEIYFTTESTQASKMTIKRTHFPGWSLRTNGDLTELINEEAFMAIPIPKGKSYMQLEYKPLSFLIGLIISCITFVVIVLVILKSLLDLTQIQRIVRTFSLKINKIGITEHIICLSVAFVVSAVSFSIFMSILPLRFQVPYTTAINWLTVNNYPKQQDIFYFISGFVFVVFSTSLLWTLWVYRKKY